MAAAPSRKWGDAIVHVIHVTFREDQQRVLLILEHIDGRLESLYIGPFAVDAKAATALHRMALEPTAHREDLPGRHDIKRLLQVLSVAEIKTVGVPMERVVRS